MKDLKTEILKEHKNYEEIASQLETLQQNHNNLNSKGPNSVVTQQNSKGPTKLKRPNTVVNNNFGVHETAPYHLLIGLRLYYCLLRKPRVI